MEPTPRWRTRAKRAGGVEGRNNSSFRTRPCRSGTRMRHQSSVRRVRKRAGHDGERADNLQRPRAEAEHGNVEEEAPEDFRVEQRRNARVRRELEPAGA
eukprot:CAMPEP_0184212060 /NCGR_PEP_ID=MMETSP0976-20121227/13446_1 /TAXON_ID=483370 /ORGANISM="non described non described, Strain CCMP2097" /LENGTH=98 /DNA_ID=CAMNT_0026516775 /DNA_START=191 /DNA_END=487 /DNA_ORIENTATION=+